MTFIIIQMKFKINEINYIRNYNYNAIYKKIYKTALYCAVEKRNIEIINLLISNDKLDINFLNVLIQIVTNIVLIKSLYEIIYHLIKLYS